jgi:tetratricopeptide (TPR) repeat protein/TolB-like protein
VIELVTLGRSAVLRDGRSVSIPPDSPEYLLLVYLAVGGPAHEEEVARLLWPRMALHRARECLDRLLQEIEERLGTGLVEVQAGRLSVPEGRIRTDLQPLRQALVSESPWKVRAAYRGPFLAGVDLSGYDDPEGDDDLVSWVRDTRRMIEAELERAMVSPAWHPPGREDLWTWLLHAARSRRSVHAGLLYVGFALGSLQFLNVMVERGFVPHVWFVALLSLHGVGLPLVVGGVWLLERQKAVPPGALVPEEARPRGVRPVHVVVVLALLTVGSLTGWALMAWERADSVSTAWASLPEEKHLAVLPFRSMNDDPSAQEFADGLGEVVATRLGQVGGLRGDLWVVPPENLRDLGVRSVRDARRAFEVTLAVGADVRYDADTIVVRVSVMDAAGEREIGSFEVSGPSSRAERIEGRIMAGLGELLDLALTSTEEEAVLGGGTLDPRAYDHFLLGQSLLTRFEREENLDRAIDRFHRALERDPDYVNALARLAEAYLRKYRMSRDPSELEEAHRAVERALEIEDGVALAHRTLGMVHAARGRHEMALEAYERALELEPLSAEAGQGMAESLNALGRIDEAEQEFRKALELRPGFWGGHNAFGTFLYSRGRFDEAVREFQQVVELTPDNSRGWANLGGLYFNLGRMEEAEEAFRRAIEIGPTSQAWANLGTLFFHLERFEDAVDAFRRAVELDDRDHLPWIYLGNAYERRPGQQGQARQAYEEARDRARAAWELNPGNAEVVAELASIHALLGEPDRARALAREAGELAPHHVQVLYRVADIHLQIGDREAAVRWSREALLAGLPWATLEQSPSLSSLLDEPLLRELSPDAEEETGAAEINTPRERDPDSHDSAAGGSGRTILSP